jgi:hypothetical protein
MLNMLLLDSSSGNANNVALVKLLNEVYDDKLDFKITPKLNSASDALSKDKYKNGVLLVETFDYYTPFLDMKDSVEKKLNELKDLMIVSRENGVKVFIYSTEPINLIKKNTSLEEGVHYDEYMSKKDNFENTLVPLIDSYLK